jgi:hypothetical protein
MFRGKINSEALNNPIIINEMKIVEFHIEHHPEANAKFWHCFRVNISDSKISSITERISKEIKKDWFSIFWNEKEIFVIFSGKIFRLSRQDKQNSKWKEAIDYGVKLGIQEQYLKFEKEIDF